MYWEDDTKPDTVGKVRITGNYTQVNITGLKANTAYYLSVAAFNTAGPGPQSAPINNTTKKPREFLPEAGVAYVLKMERVAAVLSVFKGFGVHRVTPALNPASLKVPLKLMQF